MYVVSDKQILNNPEPSSQDENQMSHPHDGLRLLAKLIAHDLLARRSTLVKKNADEVED